MPLAGFEPTISANERPQTYALDRAATGTGNSIRDPDYIEPGTAFSILINESNKDTLNVLPHICPKRKNKNINRTEKYCF